MVAGLRTILEHGALCIAVFFDSALHSNPSTDRRSTLRALVMRTLMLVIRHSLRVERTDRRHRSNAASCAGIVRGWEPSAPCPALPSFFLR